MRRQITLERIVIAKTFIHQAGQPNLRNLLQLRNPVQYRKIFFRVNIAAAPDILQYARSTQTAFGQIRECFSIYFPVQSPAAWAANPCLNPADTIVLVVSPVVRAESLAGCGENSPPDLTAVLLRGFVFASQIFVHGLKAANDKAILTALHQIYSHLFCENRTRLAGRLVRDLMPAARAASLFVVVRLFDGDFFFAIGTVAGFSAISDIRIKDIVLRDTNLCHPAVPILGERRNLGKVGIPGSRLALVPKHQFVVTDTALIVHNSIIGAFLDAKIFSRNFGVML